MKEMPSSRPTKSQIDRLGDRLRDGKIDSQQLEALDNYRRSFEPAYEEVVRRIKGELDVVPTGRPGKSVPSIVQKLRRESIRLSQMQDIAGCRIVVSDIPEQNKLIASIKTAFPQAVVVDRRARASHGYRAVHAIARVSGHPIEVQVRTELQHLWAQYSEIMAEHVDPRLKYGGGPASYRKVLATASQIIERLEAIPARSGDAARAALRSEMIEMFRAMLSDWERQR